jgi:hypothetical protein
MLPTVVQVPKIGFGKTTAVKKRRIFLECWGAGDMIEAQKIALILSKIMQERLYSKAASDSPTALPLIIPGRFNSGGNGDEEG